MTDDERPASSNDRDAEFTAWLNGLGFTIDAEELSAARQAFDRLSAMKQMNRAPPRTRRRARGGYQ
jgi:hypothetical protein